MVVVNGCRTPKRASDQSWQDCESYHAQLLLRRQMSLPLLIHMLTLWRKGAFFSLLCLFEIDQVTVLDQILPSHCQCMRTPRLSPARFPRHHASVSPLAWRESRATCLEKYWSSALSVHDRNSSYLIVFRNLLLRTKDTVSLGFSSKYRDSIRERNRGDAYVVPSHHVGHGLCLFTDFFAL